MDDVKQKYDLLCRELKGQSIGSGDSYYQKLDEVIEASVGIERSVLTSIEINLSHISGIKVFSDRDFPMQICVINASASYEVGLLFENCSFEQGFVMQSGHLKKGLTFTGCHFEGSLSVNHSMIESGVKINASRESSIEYLDLSTSQVQGGLNISDLVVEGHFSWPNTCQKGNIDISNCKFGEFKDNRLLSGSSEVAEIEFCNVEIKAGFKASGHGITHTKKITLKEVNVFDEGIILESLSSNGSHLIIENCKSKFLKVQKVGAQIVDLKSNSIKEIFISDNPSKNVINILNENKSLPKIDKIEIRSSSHASVKIDVKEIGSLSVKGSPYKKIKIISSEVGSFSLASGMKVQEELLIKDSIFGGFDVNCCVFENSCLILGTVFKQAPNFKGVEFSYNDVSFYQCKFRDVSSKYAVASYRRLKFLMSEIKNDVEEHNFSGLEMNSRMKTLSLLSPELPFSIIYKFLNNYGRSLLQPIIILFVLTVVMKYVYIHNSHFFEINKNYSNTKIYKDFSRMPIAQQAEKVAIINSLGPLRFFMTPQVIIPSRSEAQTTFFVQNVVTSILWFLIIVGIRRRFKTH